MINKKFAVIVGGVCLLGTGFAAGLIAEDTKTGAGSEAMEAMMKLGAPGPQHAEMAKYAGKWNMAGKMWMDPAVPPQDTSGKVSWEMAMDGRYLIEHVDGQPMFPGAPPFKGMNIVGYDNVTKQYFFAWIDNAGTGLMTGWGSSKDNGKTIEYMSDCPDPATGKMCKCKSTVNHESLDKVLFSMSMQMPDGSWAKNYEATYTRAK